MLNLSKILSFILLSCFLITLFFGAVNFSFAQLPEEKPTIEEKKDDTAAKTEEEKTEEKTSTGDFGLGAVEGTPKGLLIDVFIKLANWLMGIVGFALVIMLIYGGIMYMFGGVSAGKEKATNQGKNIITYAIIGIVIVFAAYLIAKFVIEAVS